MKLSDYILLSREERTAHIDLSSRCETRKTRINKNKITGFLGVEDDVANWMVGRIHRCHLCEHGRREGECNNPQHIYLGTPSENCLDIPEQKRAERVALMNEANRGRKRTPEQLERIVAGQKQAKVEGRGIGWNHTDEAKNAIREAAIRQWAKQ